MYAEKKNPPVLSGFSDRTFPAALLRILPETAAEVHRNSEDTAFSSMTGIPDSGYGIPE